MRKAKWLKISISAILSFAMAFGITLGLFKPSVSAAVDIGANPKPAIDIAVSVPSDYPGTFLDFKEELTQKLIAQGLPAGSFRITDTKVSIDTTDLNGWYVYDHYYRQSDYDALGLSADQKKKQPMRLASDSSQNGAFKKIDSYFLNGTVPDQVYNFDRHVLSYEKNGTANMAFVGYATPPYADFMIYPAASDSTRNFSFNMDASVINTHTLTGGGFLMNAGIDSAGKLYGYLLFYHGINTGNGAATLTIYKINGIDALTAQTPAFQATQVATKSVSLGGQRKARISVELKRNTVTIQQQAFNANGTLAETQDIYRDLSIPQVRTGYTYNGFGPMIGYSSHGCSAISMFQFTDLEMSYEASAFDALKNVQYYQGADYKYFINLVGDSNDPGIPKESDDSYADGINRMNENEIFYISNGDDGQVVTDSTRDEDGKLTHLGLGSENGYIAAGDDYAGLMAQYIYNNYIEGVKFKQEEVESDIPLANFYMKDAESGEQIMTIHLQHLVNSGESIKVNLVDKSKPGTLAGADGKLAQWCYNVYDPNNDVVMSTGWVDSVDKIPDYEFTKTSASGRWTFELIVKDQLGNESKISQTYLTAFLDDEHPIITGENTATNIATITLTDTGMGIDDDGITFIEDGRGSGVQYYWVTNSESDTPSEDDWVPVPNGPLHTFAFEQKIESTDPIVVWVKDECANVGNKAVFKPIHVVVEDPDGNPIDDYYVIGDNPIIVLPDDAPDSEDDEDEFSGWKTPGGDDITPGTTPTPDDENTIVIRPSYTKDKANLIYVANGGKITSSSGAGLDMDRYEVASGASIMAKIGDQNVTPKREGYRFTGWKLLNSDNEANASNSAYINNPSNLSDVDEALAVKEKNDAGETTRDTYYLIAQWETESYKLKFDANGGSLGNVQGYDAVPYGTKITTLLNFPVSGRGVPTKPGYIFQGWSESNDNDVAKIFAFGPDGSGTPVAVPNMPASDKTVYAVWKADGSKFVVSFNSNGGSKISDQAYVTATATKYDKFFTPTRAGYTFGGWFLQDADGNLGSQEYVGGEAFVQKSAHTFGAKWIAKDDTKYTVDYFINSGEKDASGNFIYKKVNEAGVTKTYTGKTEETAKIAESDKLAELTVGGATYWYDANNAHNVFEGVITGAPALSLRLYYDRYFDVKVTSNDAAGGTVTSALKQKEGTTPSVSWKAKDGYHVLRVIVNGEIRDDLITANGYTVPAALHENHEVYVLFAKDGSSTPIPGPDPSTGPNPSNPVNPTPTPGPSFYQVKTAIVGCPDGSCTITDTKRVQKGEDATVAWTLAEGYKIAKITVDGLDFSNLDTTSIDFKGILADHEVVVTVSKLPTIGGEKTDGQYTVTVNRYGGDGKSSVSKSATMEYNDTYQLTWDSGDNYKLYKIFVDGVEQTAPAMLKDSGTRSYRVRANMVIDVYFTDKDDDGTDVPVYSEDEFIKVTTKIEGGPGEITGGAVIEKDSDYNVGWTLDMNNSDPEADDYTYYEVVDVIVNGESKGKDLTDVELKNIKKDTDIVVKVQPVFYDIDLYKYGSGTISASKTVYKGQSYLDIQAAPAAGYSISKIVVDGVTVLDTVLKESPSPAPSPAPSPSTVALPDAPAKAPAKQPNAALPVQPSVEPSIEPQPEESVPTVEPSAESSVAPEDTVASVEPEESVAPAEENKGVEVLTSKAGTMAQALLPLSAPAKSQPELMVLSAGQGLLLLEGEGDATTNEYEIVTDLSLVTKSDLDLKNADATAFTMAVNGAIEDHEVKVFFTKNVELPDGTNTPTPAPKEDTLRKVEAMIQGGPGQITEGQGYYNVGEDGEVSWTIPNGYTVSSISVNGTVVATSGNSWSFEDIQEDKKVVVTLKKNGGTNDPLPPSYKVQTFEIATELRGGAGTITNTATLREGVKKTISWQVTPVEGHHYEVKYVIIDGVVRTDLRTANSVELTADRNHKVVVIIDDKMPVNVDIDGDGKPDINIDVDGDGIPDVNIDTDGDGIPDYKIDADGNGIPDDEEESGKPNEGGDPNGTGGSSIPKTGDSMNHWVLLAALFGALAMLGAILGYRRKASK